MVSDCDIEFRKVPSSPSPLPLPLARSSIGRSQNTEKRNQEILIQRVPNEPNSPVSHQTQKPNGIDTWGIAVFRDPFPGIDRFHVLSLVSEAIPGVSMKWARSVIDGGVMGVLDPTAPGEIARGRCVVVMGFWERRLWSFWRFWRVEREKGSVEEEESDG
ncbi:hypothetical protein AAC387_Pa02g3322 [Persea americana]